MNWIDATAKNNPWTTPGGDYTLVDEAVTTIASSTVTYRWEISKLVDGWVNNTFANNGLILPASVSSTATGTELRLKKLGEVAGVAMAASGNQVVSQVRWFAFLERVA